MDQPQDKPQESGPHPHFPSLRNWVSMSGGVIALGSLFAFILLFAIDSFARFNNPYMGVLTYLVAPFFLLLGLFLGFLGVFIEHRRTGRAYTLRTTLHFDFARARDRRILSWFLSGSAFFLLLTAVGSYYSYHFTESPTFCGQVCHKVMQPEMTTYENSPHARVSCAACHIGPGATWYMRSKLSGTYQVYATFTKQYPRPIPTPVKNLRPAPETCERCHWPKEFVGNVDRTFAYFQADETNSPYTLRLLLKVGGADPTHGPVEGIHWHMNVANRIQYIATDSNRLTIPWVRLTDQQGVVTEYRTAKFTNDPSQYQLRTMDCMDCHNRPTHIFSSPDQAVNLALRLGQLDPSMPWLKSNAVFLLASAYSNVPQALQAIKTGLSAKYPNHPRLESSIQVLHRIYTNNFFPLMNANWRAYPNNIGHMIWAGCMRCHDDKHVAADKKHKIRFDDCNMCHIIIAQGSGAQLDQLSATGQKFNHPGGELSPGDVCADCHTGGP